MRRLVQKRLVRSKIGKNLNVNSRAASHADSPDWTISISIREAILLQMTCSHNSSFSTKKPRKLRVLVLELSSGSARSTRRSGASIGCDGWEDFCFRSQQQQKGRTSTNGKLFKNVKGKGDNDVTKTAGQQTGLALRWTRSS